MDFKKKKPFYFNMLCFLMSSTARYCVCTNIHLDETWNKKCNSFFSLFFIIFLDVTVRIEMNGILKHKIQIKYETDFLLLA